MFVNIYIYCQTYAKIYLCIQIFASDINDIHTKFYSQSYHSCIVLIHVILLGLILIVFCVCHQESVRVQCVADFLLREDLPRCVLQRVGELHIYRSGGMSSC